MSGVKHLLDKKRVIKTHLEINEPVSAGSNCSGRGLRARLRPRRPSRNLVYSYLEIIQFPDITTLKVDFEKTGFLHLATNAKVQLEGLRRRFRLWVLLSFWRQCGYVGNFPVFFFKLYWFLNSNKIYFLW